MNLYLISQNENDEYDTFDSAVVAAPNEHVARRMDPQGVSGEPWHAGKWRHETWCAPEHVSVRLIGEATSDVQIGVILSSFNAG